MTLDDKVGGKDHGKSLFIGGWWMVGGGWRVTGGRWWDRECGDPVKPAD